MTDTPKPDHERARLVAELVAFAEWGDTSNIARCYLDAIAALESVRAELPELRELVVQLRSDVEGLMATRDNAISRAEKAEAERDAARESDQKLLRGGR